MAYIDITAVAYFDEFDRHASPLLKKMDKGELVKNVKQTRKEIEKKWSDSRFSVMKF